MTDRLRDLLPEVSVKQVLGGGLSRHLGRRVRVTGLSGRSMGTFSSHPISRLAVTLDDGDELPVIFKRLKPHPDKDVRREVRLYQRVLAGGRFGAPMLYAALCDDVHLRYWLFLEDVGQQRLEWCPAEGWVPAFRWMAQMHADCLSRAQELSNAGCLDEHGPGFYGDLAVAARGSLVTCGESLAVARFDRIVGRWLSRSVACLEGQPRTLVHGDLSCHNVMVQRDSRIRPIDWEWAAVGPAAWDVAKLLAGWGRRKRGFLAAYLDEFGRHAAAPPDRVAFTAAVAHARVLHKLWYLKWWTEPCRDPAFVDRLLDTMERTWRRLDNNEIARALSTLDNDPGPSLGRW